LATSFSLVVLLKTYGKNDQYFDRETKSTYQFLILLETCYSLHMEHSTGKGSQEIKA